MLRKVMKRKNKKQKKIDPTYLPGSRVPLSFRKHIVPPLAGLLMMMLALGLFNSQIIFVKIASLNYKPPTAVASKDTDLANKKPDLNAPASLTINSIGVNAPVIYSEKTVDESRFQLALRDGVVHYPNTAEPGKPGNVVIFGHSSGQVWAPGNYKFVFTHLDKVQKGDKIFADYQGTRYIYNVTDKHVVSPTNISVLNPTDKNTLTLITCTPVGTNKNRLIIVAEQVAPKPATEKSATDHTQAELELLPGTVNPSFWQSLRELL